MSNRHSVFVGFYHALDESYKKIFELFVGNAFGAIVPGSVRMGEIDPNLPTDTIRQKIRIEHLRDTSVTVVLIGAEMRQRNRTAWEVGSSIRDAKANPRSGLVSILLPPGPRADKSKYNPKAIPPRLYDNIECGFASIHDWSEDAAIIQGWIYQAYLRKSTMQPDNSRASFGKNRTGTGWAD